MSDVQAEKVRLIIWDLDETFWLGTLTEGGITYRRDTHDIVLELARRGIVSSICSKNDVAPVRDVLEREGIWDSFVFPSINWEAKGPRLAALVEAVQLRPPTILFIDDNPMNRAEAQHFVPGIQVADETIIPEILNNPLCKGKDDSGLTRLAQYKLLERRQTDAQAAGGGDNREFLRKSNIRVTIEHDLTPHLDRAVELINRTNQLNYTKLRLSENPATAREELLEILGGFNVQAGILRVRDNYGDYGYCGLYLMFTDSAGKRLRFFCFSCRILNMGVETWLYNKLGRPALRVQGEVLTDVVRNRQEIDWITVVADEAEDVAAAAPTLDYIYARGGCELHAITHYFSVVAKKVHLELSTTRKGANVRFDHSVFAQYALRGVAPEFVAALEKIGYMPDDFLTIVPELPSTDNAAWILSFWADSDYALYRHKATGAAAPLALPGVRTNHRDMTEPGKVPNPSPEVAALLDIVQREFEFGGMIERPQFVQNLRTLLRRARPGMPVFIILANEVRMGERRRGQVIPKKHALNTWTRQVAQGFSNVELIDINSFIHDPDEAESFNHFDRMVYYRVYQHIMQRLQERATPAADRDAA